MHRLAWILLLLSLGSTSLAAAEQRPNKQRPNIVLIMADDLGFSDIGCYGSEIHTPNLDRLAAHGLRFSQFYNCAKCETTRATLLSGRYYQEVGVQRIINCVTIAEVMRSAGYTTLMTGKWHLQSTPVQRGFDHYFGHLSGATNYFWGDKTFRLDANVFTVPRQGFYITDANTDYAIQFLKQRDTNRPFFLYVAYNAPHYPLQAPEEEVAKYRGKYKIGWDQLRAQRYARIKQLGLLQSNWKRAPRPKDVPAWDTLTPAEQDQQDLVMATYAGMIDRMDQNIGRLVDTLEQMGVLDNTLVIFLSDNGACPFQRTSAATRKNQLMPWNPESYWTYDKGWAHACNTPFREYKRNQHEGGISTPLIAHWPRGIAGAGKVTPQVGHLVDIMATCIDVAGATYPKQYGETLVGPARGLSLVPVLAGHQRTPHPYLFFSFYGTHNALRVGNWKLVNIDRGPWELYDMRADRTELNDLAGSQPERRQQMEKQWADVISVVGDPNRKASTKKQGKNKNAKKKQKK